jgi:hypothetical protein
MEGRIQDAKGQYEQVLRLNPDDVVAHVPSRNGSSSAAETPRGGRAVRTGVPDYPLATPAAINLARIFAFQEHIDGAAALLKSVPKANQNVEASEGRRMILGQK